MNSLEERLSDIIVKAQKRFYGVPEPMKAKLERRKKRVVLQEPKKAKIGSYTCLADSYSFSTLFYDLFATI